MWCESLRQDKRRQKGLFAAQADTDSVKLAEVLETGSVWPPLLNLLRTVGICHLQMPVAHARPGETEKALVPLEAWGKMSRNGPGQLGDRTLVQIRYVFQLASKPRKILAPHSISLQRWPRQGSHWATTDVSFPLTHRMQQWRFQEGVNGA